MAGWLAVMNRTVASIAFCAGAGVLLWIAGGQHNVSIPEILMRSREKLLSLGDPTVLAYVFYGDARFRAVAAN